MIITVQKFFLLLIFFTIITSFGFIFSRRLLKENRIIYLIPLSICFGVSLLTVILHLVSLLTGIKTATYTCLLILLTITLIIPVKFKPTNKIILGVSKLQFFLLGLLVFLISSLSLWYLLTFDSFDSIAKAIGPMAKQNCYPPVCGFCPEASSMYHYGAILFSTALVIFSNIEIWNSLIPLQIIFIFITPIIIFIFCFSTTNNFMQSIFGSLIGCFCANLISLNLFTLFNPEVFSSLTLNIYKTLVLMNEGGFVTTTTKAIITPNMSVAIPLSLMLFFLCTNKDTSENNYYYIIILSISSFLFFTYESFWFPIVMAIFLFHLTASIKSRFNKTQLLKSTILMLILMLSPVLVSTVISNKNTNITQLLYFNPKTYIFSWIGLLNYFYPQEWLSSHLIISQIDGVRLYKVPFFSKYFFVEFGLPLILLPFIFLWLIVKKKNPILLFYLFSGLISFAIPFLVNYLPREVETIRFFTYSRFVFSTLLGVFIGRIMELKLRPLLSITLRSFFVFLIFILVVPGIVWLIPLNYIKGDYRPYKISNVDRNALRWLSKNVRVGDRGVGPSDNATIFDLINLAGVYGVGISKIGIFQGTTRNTAITTLNPCLLKELKVRWIYLNQDLLTKVPQNTLNELIKEQILFLRYKYKQADEIREIYEFHPNNTDKYCNNKNYAWALGQMYDGMFTPLLNATTMSQIVFPDKESAFQILKELKQHLDRKDAYFYRVEAIKYNHEKKLN